jgi:serine protease inhibitor
LKSVASQGSLGVKDIFEANTADLSEISRERLEVGDVLHSAQLEVNEEGSEAAAVTSIDIDIRLAASGKQWHRHYLLK